MRITILTDNKKSWFIDYALLLNKEFSKLGYQSDFITEANDIKKGDICFLLSCTKILPKKQMRKNKNNIVIHGSDLPQGKGFSPLQWQIIEGKNEIVLTLFEAVEELDAGDYYFKEKLVFKGTELLDELRGLMGEKIIEMALKFVQDFETKEKYKQKGEESFYAKRRISDDKLDINKPLIDLFNSLRVADNTNFPMFFEFKGKRFNLKIEKRDE